MPCGLRLTSELIWIVDSRSDWGAAERCSAEQLPEQASSTGSELLPLPKEWPRDVAQHAFTPAASAQA